jgi:hypothetical protein
LIIEFVFWGSNKILLPAIIPEMTSVFNEVPVPAFAGYGIDLQECFSTAAIHGHLALTANIVPIQTTLNAAAPATFADVVNRPNNSLAKESNTDKEDETVVLAFSGVDPLNETLKYRYKIDNGS